MPEIIIFAFLLIPAVIGVITVVQDIMLFLVTPKKCDDPILVVPFNSNSDETEFVLKGAGFRARLFGSRYCCRVIAVDKSCNYKNSEVCLKSYDDMSYIDICGSDELISRIFENN